MPECSDIYVISEKRDLKTVEGFLDKFAPKREESAVEYEVPQYSENLKLMFKSAVELIRYCIKNSSTEHTIYWRALDDNKPEHAMVFYLEDAYVIYGLSTDAMDQKYVKSLLEHMKSYLGSSLAYIAHEASPTAGTLKEFEAQIELHK